MVCGSVGGIWGRGHHQKCPSRTVLHPLWSFCCRFMFDFIIQVQRWRAAARIMKCLPIRLKDQTKTGSWLIEGSIKASGKNPKRVTQTFNPKVDVNQLFVSPCLTEPQQRPEPNAATCGHVSRKTTVKLRWFRSRSPVSLGAKTIRLTSSDQFLSAG